jgi:hypothetical protein
LARVDRRERQRLAGHLDPIDACQVRAHAPPFDELGCTRVRRGRSRPIGYPAPVTVAIRTMATLMACQELGASVLGWREDIAATSRKV